MCNGTKFEEFGRLFKALQILGILWRVTTLRAVVCSLLRPVECSQACTSGFSFVTSVGSCIN